MIPSKPIPLRGFNPDLDPLTPGLMLDCSNLVPTMKGYRSYPSLARYNSDTLPSAGLGAFTGLIGNTSVITAGTTDQLHLLNPATLQWIDQGLTLIPISVNERWRFDIYGNLLLAANGQDPVQAYNGTGTYAPLPGSPPIAAIVQASDFSLFLIPPNSNVFWSSLSPFLWTPSIATQTVTDAVDETQGNIVGAHKLRAGMTLYKRKSFHFSSYEGPPFYWKFTTVSKEIGAPSQEAIANLGDIHYWPNPPDFYKFDGYSFGLMPNAPKEWFYSNLDGTLIHKITARWDAKKDLIFWHFPSTQGHGTLDGWIAFHRPTEKWSMDLNAVPIDCPVFAPVRTSGMTYGTFKARHLVYNASSIPETYGEIQPENQEISGVIRSSDDRLCLYSGAPGPAFWTTHDYGDRDNMYTCSRFRPHFTLYPASGASLQVYNQYTPGKGPVLAGQGSRPPGSPGMPSGATANPLTRPLSSDGWFNFVNTARLQRFKITGNSEFEVVAQNAVLDYAGEV